jgi:hypothetical protein
MYKKLLLFLFLTPVVGFAQGTYDLVYSILNTKCQNAGCHSATSADALKFDGTKAAVYSALVNQIPANSAAAAKGHKLLWTNQPYESYLLRKIGGFLDTDLSIDTATEGAVMNDINGNNLTNKEVEYIRQWVMNGTKQTGNNIDTTLINAYYNDTARAPFYPKPAAPAPGTGYRLRFGPIFVSSAPSKSEIEYVLKHEVNFPYNVEVNEIDGDMNPQSHHFLLFKHDDSAAAASMADGLRLVSLTGGTTSFDGNKKLVGAWQTPAELHLPARTAMFWEKKTWLDFNFHMKNYSTTGVLPFDFYLNCMFTERLPSSTTIEMKSRLVNNVGFLILPNSTYTNPYADGDNGANETRYIWMISSHTHKFGTNFDIFKYDNTKPGNIGDTIYNGTYDYENGFDLGHYDWEHPSIRRFDPLLPINMQTNGIICKTTWKNTSNSLIHFGFTTNDEMQLYYYMYTSELPTTGIKENEASNFNFIVYPNPMNDMGTISYKLDKAASIKATVVDVTGKEIAVLREEKQTAGTYNVDMGGQQLSAGIYFARLSVDGSTTTRKFIVE